jgi:hypothetical protein
MEVDVFPREAKMNLEKEVKMILERQVKIIGEKKGVDTNKEMKLICCC